MILQILKFVQILQSSLLTGKIGTEVAIETISTSDEYIVNQWLNETTYSYSEFTLHMQYLLSTYGHISWDFAWRGLSILCTCSVTEGLESTTLV